MWYLINIFLNKRLLENHGFTAKGETIVVLQIVKVFMIKNGNIKNVVVGKDLLSSYGDASERY